MKLTLLFLVGFWLGAAANGYSQTITLAEHNVPLATVFKKIEKQTPYSFVYRDEWLAKAKKVGIKVTNASLEEVLQRCFEGQPLTYTIIANTIVVKEKVEKVEMTDAVAVRPPVDVRGRVVNENGEPVVATVTVKGTAKAVSTNESGEFELKGVEENATLVFSGVNIVNYEVKVNGRADLSTIRVKTKISTTQDVVVVGYGTARRKDLTGSVASVATEEIKNTPFVTLDQALTGKATGVQVVQADGSPGGMAKIRIRGGTSLMGGNDPLYIIDGIPVTIQNRYLQSAAEIVSPVERFGSDNPNNAISGSFARGLNSLGGLSINDIESIDILKDASATAIYGSRAANGVVIITTKKGKKNQKPTLEANYYAGVSSPIKEEVLKREQYIAVMKEGAKNLNTARAKIGRTPDATATAILNDPNFFGTSSTDWLDHVLQRGFSQNADLALRGGGTASRYTASLGYTSNEGAVLGTDFKRVSGVIDLDNEITDRLRFITHMEYGFTRNRITNGVYSQAFFMPPTLPAYNPDGSIHVINAAALGSADYQGYQNPLLLLKGKNLSNQMNLRGSMSGEYDILRSLKFKSVVSVNYINYEQDNYTPSVVRIASPNGTGTTPGVATQAHSRDVNVFFENTLTWDKQFNPDNRINLLAGTSWQKGRFRSFTASGQGFPDDEYLNNLSSAAVALAPLGTSGQNSLLSFYLRANYAVKEKYLFTFTGRSDISSKFPVDNRVAYTPSGGVAWRVSEEKFLSGAKWLSELKLRASAGYTGTQNLGDNLFYTLYSPGSYGGTNALVPSQLGNEELTWEVTLQKDAGMDLALFGSRLRAAFGVYEKDTRDILYTTAVATSSGFNSLVSNIARIRNRGLEIDVRGDFMKRKNFQWTGAVNVTQNRSKVLSISNDLAVQQNGYARFGNTALMVGQPLGVIYGRVFTGILRTEKDVEEYKKENLLAGFGLYPYLDIGDARYKVYTSGNMKGFLLDTVIGNAEPKFFGGYTNSLQYKNVSLVALLTFSYGGDILYLADVQAHDLATRGNKSTRILDYWTPDNPNSENPRLLLGQSAYAYTASNNVYDASFIKLKSITLNYEFPQSLLSRIKVRNASMYLSASNVFTITNYPGADPEVSNDPYSIIGGYSDVGGYPTVRQFNAGVRFGF